MVFLHTASKLDCSSCRGTSNWLGVPVQSYMVASQIHFNVDFTKSTEFK